MTWKIACSAVLVWPMTAQGRCSVPRVTMTPPGGRARLDGLMAC
jgi:hypothetical protein